MREVGGPVNRQAIAGAHARRDGASNRRGSEPQGGAVAPTAAAGLECERSP
jgi:hypothetical protein